MLARLALLAAGHTEADESEAELHVINTCCITGEAESKSRQSARRSLRTARQVYVSGCAVNLDPAQFAQLDARVTPVTGRAEEVARSIAALAASASATGDGLGAVPHDGLQPACADLERDLLARDRAALAGGRTRGFVKVQDGCDSSCAYCIIPTVRGGARSRPASAVLDEVASASPPASPRW